jgi:hypothetical protein
MSKIIRYKPPASPNRLPHIDEGEILVFSPEQIASLRSNTTLTGRITIINIKGIEGYVYYHIIVSILSLITDNA